jgi:tyrosyl-tRNA synthetase
MSKSLNNAIGINEPPAEMYGKLMSISDQLMWSYWLLLTDLRQSEVDALRTEVASGNMHPMAAKKLLARTIVTDFHGEAAALAADENWARMFQQKEAAEDLEEVAVAYADLVAPAGLPNPADQSGPLHIRLPKLLIQLGLAASGAEASRKLAEKAVKLDGEVATNALIPIPALPARLVVRLGKRAKVALIS